MGAEGQIRTVTCLRCDATPKVFQPSSHDGFTAEHMVCPECGKRGVFHNSLAGLPMGLMILKERVRALEARITRDTEGRESK